MQDLEWDEMEQRLEAAQARLAPAGATLALHPGELVIRIEVPSSRAACEAAEAIGATLAELLDLPEMA